MGRSMGFQAMDLNSDHHSLLESRTATYSNLTIRRAYIVWLRCGQKNQFKDVCNYYHRLEEYENTLPEYTRAVSRHHEFSLFITDPPASPYQMSLFPNLYSAPHQPSFKIPLYNHVYVHSQPTRQTRVPVVIEEIYEPVVSAKLGQRKSSEVSLEEIFLASQVFKTPEEPLNNKMAAELDICAVKFPEVQNINEHTNYESNEHEIDEPNKLTTDESKELIMDESNEPMTNECNEHVIDKSGKQTVDECNKNKKNDVPEKDILKTIQLVHNYCTELQIPVRNFWKSFNEYASRSQLSNSVYNVSFYVNNKMAESELPMALFELKVKSYEKIKKSPPKKENRTIVAPVNETQDSPSTSHEQDEEDIEVNLYGELKRENDRKEEDLILFVDRIKREQEETIKKFFEEANVDFSNKDDDEHDDVSKCRKI